MKTSISSPLAHRKRAKFTMTASVSTLSLMMAASLSTTVNAQTFIPDEDNTTVRSEMAGEFFIVDPGATTTVDGGPAIVFANEDVFLDNSGTIESINSSTTIQINADADGAIILNNEGAVITGDSRVINVDGDDALIINDGAIVGSGDQRNGVIHADVTSDNLTLINGETGVVDAGAGNNGAAVVILLGGDAPIDGAIDNDGLIQGRGQASSGVGAAGDGIRLGQAGGTYIGAITNTSTGVINSESNVGAVAGFRVTDGVNFQGTLDNAGTISGARNGVYFGNGDHTGSLVTNTGIISSDSRAFNIDGTGLTLVNQGDIIGTGDQRNGTVYADDTADDFTFVNDGLVDAGAGNDGSGFVAAIGGAADGANTFLLDNDGVIQGRGAGGAATGTAGDGVRIGSAGDTGITDAVIINSGTITSDSTVGATAGLRVVDGVGFQGTLDNSGTISGTQNGVYFGNGDHTGGVVTNTGTISSDSRAFNIDGTGLTVINTGNIIGTGDQRNGTLYADGTADDFTVVNEGFIVVASGSEGSGFAVEVGDAEDGVTTFVLDNSGIIAGAGQGAANTGAAGDGVRIGNSGDSGITDATITNSGGILSLSEVGTVAGLRVVDGVGFQGTLDNSGEIFGRQNGVYFGNGDHTGGVVTNSGTISSDSRAFNIDGTGLTVVNAGEIVGTGDQRNGTVYADGTADDFTFVNDGLIDAGAGNEGAGVAIELGGAADGANTFTFDNSGFIQGRGNAAADTAAAGDGFRIGNPGGTGITDATITNSGFIDSEGANGAVAGVRVVDGAGFQGSFENSGIIAGVQNGVYFGNGDHTGGVFTNTVDGLILSDSRAFHIGGTGLTLNNDGVIVGVDNQRNGTIFSDETADDFTINNSETGVIDADGGDGTGFTAGIGGAADGANTFVLNNAGVIQGRGQGGAATGEAGDGVRIGSPGDEGLTDAVITNTVTGVINSESDVGTVAGLRVVDGVGFQGTLDNAGTITGVRNGVYFGNGDHTGGVVTNAAGALISSDSRAFNIDGTGLTVNNSGEILATAEQRNGTFYADSTAQDFTLNNLAGGVIDGGAGLNGAAVSVELSEAGNAFVINNDGLIQGRGAAGAGLTSAGDGIRFERARVDGTLDGTTTGLFTGTINNNAGGLITSESDNGTTAGIRFVNGTSFQGTINNAGTISGVQNGVYFGNAVGAGGADHTGGVFNNLAGGVVSSDSRAFNIDGTGLTVNNFGSIVGTGDQRDGTVYADGTADDFTITNASTGVIDAGEGNQGSGVSLQLGDGADFTLDNAGTIQGRGDALASGQSAGLRLSGATAGATATGNITNSGLISSETAAAILVEDVNFAGTITNSGQLVGINVFDGSAALGAITFNQIGGAFNTNFIGSNFADSLSLGGPNFGLNADILGNVITTVESGTNVDVSGIRALEGNLISNGELTFNLGADILNVTGDTIFNAGSVVNLVTTQGIGDIALGETIEVITRTGDFTDNGLTVNIDEDDFLVDYIVGINANNLSSLNVTAGATDLSALSDDANISALGAGITSAFTAGQLTAAQTAFLNGLADTAAFEEAAVQLLPSVNEGISREIWETNKRNFGYINRRLSANAKNGLWGEVAVRGASRDEETLSSTGYDADTLSYTVGYDRDITESFRAGVSYSFSDIEIDEEGVVLGDRIEIETNFVSGYARYDFGQVALSGQVGYVFGDGDSSRSSGLGAITGDFDVDGIIAQGAVGYDLVAGGLNVQPQLGFRFGSISQDDYTETGGLNLNVDAEDVDYFEGVVGFTAAPIIPSSSDWSIRPSLSANYVNDFTADSRDINITFPGSTTQTLTSGDPRGTRFEIGGQIDIVNAGGIAFGVGYEGDFSADYSSNAGFLRARYGF
ncbi:MAG: autotransporter outer membrane beta-barrel domain-containing protein [Litorimonas sp.]